MMFMVLECFPMNLFVYLCVIIELSCILSCILKCIDGNHEFNMFMWICTEKMQLNSVYCIKCFLVYRLHTLLLSLYHCI
jgi:hypothetical protein